MEGFGRCDAIALSNFMFSESCNTRVNAKNASMLINFSYQDGVFDEAVKGVDAIEHTASPVRWNAVDPQGGCSLYFT